MYTKKEYVATHMAAFFFQTCRCVGSIPGGNSVGKKESAAIHIAGVFISDLPLRGFDPRR